MKRLTRTVLVSALIVAVTAISVAPAGAARGGTDRPYKASGNGTGVVDIEGCSQGSPIVVCDQVINQTVKGTHIGRSTRSTEGTITLDFDNYCIGPDGPDGEPQFGVPFVSLQDGTIVAANGDELLFDEVVTGCFVNSDTDSQPSGVYTITGGTGRFDDASGEGTLAGATFGETGITTKWTGTISY